MTARNDDGRQINPPTNPPILVLLSAGSVWSWRIVDQLQHCGWTPITVDIRSDIQPNEHRAVDYRIRMSSVVPRTWHLRRIASRHGIAFGMCLYGGRQALELLLLTYCRSGFRYAVFAAGSDVLRPGSTRSKAFLLASRRAIATALAKAEIVLCNGQHIVRAARDSFGCNINAVAWYQGIDCDSIDAIRFEAGEAVVSILAPRPWLPVYNNGAIVDGLRKLRERQLGRDYVVRFVGPGISGTDIGHLSALTSAAAGFVVEHQDGYAPTTRGQLFASHDIVISMARSDGVANAVLEAAFAGCMPILSDIPANRNLVDQFGLLATIVPLDDPQSLASAILGVVANRNAWPAIAETNRLVIARNLSTIQSQRTLCDHLAAFEAPDSK